MPYEEFIVTKTSWTQIPASYSNTSALGGQTGFIKFFSHHDPLVMNTAPTVNLTEEIMKMLKLVFENSTMSPLIQKRQTLPGYKLGLTEMASS